MSEYRSKYTLYNDRRRYPLDTVFCKTIGELIDLLSNNLISCSPNTFYFPAGFRYELFISSISNSLITMQGTYKICSIPYDIEYPRFGSLVTILRIKFPEFYEEWKKFNTHT